MGCSSCETIEIKNERFRKEKEIGNLNFLIRSERTKEDYAYKIIDIRTMKDEEKIEILNDVISLKKLDHPNIILVKTAYFSDDKKYLYVISEYADGGNLQMKLNEQKQKNKYFDTNTLLDWFMQICFALQYIHSKNILHKNIKPSNIFLMKQNKENFAKLGDFGVSKVLKSSLKKTKTIISSVQYQPPEMIEKKDYSFETDIWSLGVTFYQLITLNEPFEDNIFEINDNILKGNIKQIPKDCKIDKKFIELIKEMLKVRPEERPSLETILQNSIINTRMKCYLEENNFDEKKVENEINQLKEEENKNKNDESKEISELEKELKDIINKKNKKSEKHEKNRNNVGGEKNTINEEKEEYEEKEKNTDNEEKEEYEKNVENENNKENEENEKKEKKFQYDLLRQMKTMKTQYIKNSTFSY